MRIRLVLLAAVFCFSACDNPQEPTVPELQGWIQVSVTSYQYTPHTLTVWVSRPSSINSPDSFQVLHPAADTTYISAQLVASDSDISATFSFPDGYLATFYPPNTYIYTYPSFDDLKVSLHY